MNKKKIVIIALLLLAVLLALTGCSEETGEEKKIKEIVTSYLTEYTNLSSSSNRYLSRYQFHSDEQLAKIEMSEIEKPIAKHLEFKILKVKKTENGYSVKTELKNYDFADIFERIIVPALEGQATEQEIISLMNAETAKGQLKKKSTTVEIPLALYGNDYKIVSASMDDVANAMVGGMNEAYANYQMEQFDKMVEEAGNPIIDPDDRPENYWDMNEEEWNEYRRNKFNQTED